MHEFPLLIMPKSVFEMDILLVISVENRAGVWCTYSVDRWIYDRGDFLMMAE